MGLGFIDAAGGIDVAGGIGVAGGFIDVAGGVDAAFWTRYWFMLPTATAVATLCLLSGIGGAALFSPIFLLVFPLLGSEYVLPSPATAFSTALITECFGFSSGLLGYMTPTNPLIFNRMQ
jgi:uncharacterized membrane protein YfcA